jgi:hypothetical protein
MKYQAIGKSRLRPSVLYWLAHHHLYRVYSYDDWATVRSLIPASVDLILVGKVAPAARISVTSSVNNTA